ncbi:MAG: autotransporter-associated beta strand repeat-containing protein, partial [Kiritimatiellaeota bacterium]|nr:autotransporter-associated beta strand repeat-containing protein [Kiritimatiellota bacterium]
MGALIMSAPNYTLTLSASNTYSGGTIISNGIIRIASTVTNNSANTVLGSGNTTIVSGGALDLTGVTTTNSLYFSGKTFTIAGSGVTNSGAIFNNSAVTQINAFQKIILAGDASVGGSQRYDIRGGVATLDLANNTLTKTGTGYIGVVGGLITAGNIVISNGTFSIQTSTVCTGTVGTITVQTGGALDFYQTTAGKITRPIRLNGGSITIGSTATVDSPITLATNATINTSSGSLTLNGTIVESGGSFALTKLGANTLTLTNNTAYTGGTVVNAGNIQFNTLASVPISGLITINAGGTLNASGAYTPDGWLTSGRIATNSAGTLALTAYNNAPLDFSSSNFANLYLGAVGTITNDGAITPANNTYRLGGGGGTLVITNNLALTSANSLVFNTNGANNVSLTGSNTYSGGTTIGGATIGWLYASNNSALGTGPVTLTTSVNGGLWVYGGTTLSNNLVIGDSTGNGTFQVSGGNVNMAGNVTLTNLSGINIRIGVATGSTLTFNGVISGTIGGALMFNRTTFGAIVFNTNMTYTASST